jgi:hypothetical protein
MNLELIRSVVEAIIDCFPRVVVERYVHRSWNIWRGRRSVHVRLSTRPQYSLHVPLTYSTFLSGNSLLYRFGCYVVQRCFDLVASESPSLKAAMIKSLCDNLLTIATDSFGNYAAQYFIERMTPMDLELVIPAIKNNVSSLTIHQIGVRFYFRCFRSSYVN